jgi:hypothetical protein
MEEGNEAVGGAEAVRSVHCCSDKRRTCSAGRDILRCSAEVSEDEGDGK